MKKIAIMGSGNGSNFEAIANYFNNSNVDITCLSDKKDSYILKRAKKLGTKNEYLPFEENFEYFKKNKFDLVVLAGYMRILPKEVLYQSEFINIHPSLLPSFRGKKAIERAFLAGVKVSGITIHWVESDVDKGRIIAQYPVFIESQMSLDEFEQKIHSIEHQLFPLVIEKILEDKAFDFQDFLKTQNNSGSCSGGCSGCK